MELNGTLEPTSEDEFTLMGEVEVLEMKLTAAGHPPNELVKKRFDLRINAQAAQPLAVRVKSWNDRKAHLQLLVQSSSGGSAVSGPVLARAAERINDATKIEEGEASQNRPGKRESVMQANGLEEEERPEEAMPGRKRPKKPVMSYKVNDDGSPCEMREIHARFIEKNVAQLTVAPFLSCRELIADWNKSSAISFRGRSRQSTGGRSGTMPSGRADNFFVNGYVSMADLVKMVGGELPLPVVIGMPPIKVDPVRRAAADEDRDGIPAIRRPAREASPCPTSAGGRSRSPPGRRAAREASPRAGGRGRRSASIWSPSPGSSPPPPAQRRAAAVEAGGRGGGGGSGGRAATGGPPARAVAADDWTSDGEHDPVWEAELALWESANEAAAKGNMAPLNKMVAEAQAEAREERLEACRRAEEGPVAEMQRVTDLWKALALATIPASNASAPVAGGSKRSSPPAHRASEFLRWKYSPVDGEGGFYTFKSAVQTITGLAG